ncbi:uncharacterized protein LOC127754179 isoform X1 [Oryza glaberrima]|uniref:DUF3615 domain-containing protein n=2 Tax=Oryza barthii TaxID=65489 RepID=A0A0D3HPF7_9ORYZ|nr:uncharacterized protein LOC127754179 isoform X1 [Oryza glaberrima]
MYIKPSLFFSLTIYVLSVKVYIIILQRSQGNWNIAYIQQSALYSQRKRRSGQKRGGEQSPTLPVKERDDDVSSSELGPTSKDLSKVEALSLDDSPHASGSTDCVVVHVGNTGSDGLDSTFAQPAALEEAVSPSLSEEIREYEEYLKEHTFDSMEAAFEYLRTGQRVVLPKVEFSDDESSSEQFLLEKSEDQSTLEPEHDQSVVTQGQCDDSSFEEITQNGKKWMNEEVMVAFEKYITRRDDLKEYDYQFDELLHQCFNVEHYYKIFHHFNFTVKMKAPCSTDWTSVLYFAEVKELLGHKIYFCSPLEPNEDGNCYACKNQGMENLKHPIVGVFDRGFPTQVFPYTYSSGSEDEAWL